MRADAKYISDILESDEELPTEYSETADLPAYLNDKRFEPVEYQWIDKNFSKYYLEKKSLKTSRNILGMSTQDVISDKIKDLNAGDKVLILNGFLNEQDIYCFKSIQQIIGDDTLLWFIRFMENKDLHSNTKFIRSCLVSDVVENPIHYNSNLFYTETKKYEFDIVIKNK